MSKHHTGLLPVLSQVLNFLVIFGFLPKILKWNIFVALINVCMLGPEKLSGYCHNPIPLPRLFSTIPREFEHNSHTSQLSCYCWLLLSAWVCSAARACTSVLSQPHGFLGCNFGMGHQN